MTLLANNGGATAIALKVLVVLIDRGRVREEQALWHEAMRRRGLPTFVARSADEAVRQVEVWCAEVDGAL